MGESAEESQLEAVKRLAEKHFKRKRGVLADLAGVPRNTVQKILMGYTRQPLSGTLQKLYDALIRVEDDALKALQADVERLQAEADALQLKTGGQPPECGLEVGAVACIPAPEAHGAIA